MKLYQQPKNMKNFSVYVQYHDWPVMHKHTYWEFLILTKGSLIHKINGETKTIAQNTLWIIRPNDGHSLHNVPKQTSSHIVLRVSCEYLQGFLDHIDNNLYQKLLECTTPLCFPLKTSTANRITDSTYKVFTTSTKDSYESHCTILFLDIFRAFYYQLIKQEKTSTQYSSIVSQLIYMINNPANLKKDFRTLIEELNYSYSHINRLFTQETGVSPSKYLKQQRLNYAKQLLTETDLDLNTVASEIGYTSYSHFLVAFQKELNISPSDYRKSQEDYSQNDTKA